MTPSITTQSTASGNQRQAAAPLNSNLRGRQNRAVILQCLREKAPISRRGLSEATGTRPNTVGDIVNDLMQEGLIQEVGAVVGRRGRRRRLLDLSSQGCVLGAEAYEGMVRVGALTLRGEIRDLTEHPLRNGHRAEVISTMVKGLRSLADGVHVMGCGVAIAGVVDSTRGISRRVSGFEDWADVPVAEELHSALGVETHLTNLTEARLLDLKQAGTIQPGMTAALVVLESGAVGCGIVAEGQILRGAVEASSELGQTLVTLPDGEVERLENLTEWKRLRAEVRARGGVPPRGLRALFESDERPVVETRLWMVENLGISLANLALIIKPSHLWLTGSLATFEKGLVKPLCTAVRSHLLPAFDEALTIEVLHHGPEAGVRGAGGLILDRLFAMPEVRFF